MKNISILGSTGSIGVNTLDVISKNMAQFKAVALAAGKNIKLLSKQIEVFRPKIVAVIDESHARSLCEEIGKHNRTKVLWGVEGYRELASISGTDMVVSAIIGAAGLLPTVEAIEAGKDIALANKETMVMAGKYVVERAKEKNVKILPVDSEHNAVFQCLIGHKKEDIKRIILTASGGPFLNLPKERLVHVKPSDALKHPNWEMGTKITVDSASLMNKGLEVIEAKWLFGVDVDRIDVQIHPQSIIHSMVEYIDGSVIAQLGVPDMRGPILYALSYPDRLTNVGASLDLCEVGKLEFFRPDFDKFPNLKLAYKAAKSGGAVPAVLNASNEIAVEAFVAGKIGFIDITKVVEKTVNSFRYKEPSSIEDILKADSWGRREAEKNIERIGL